MYPPLKTFDESLFFTKLYASKPPVQDSAVETEIFFIINLLIIFLDKCI